MIDGRLLRLCVSQTAYERCSCSDEEHCGLRMLMLDVRSVIANILDHYTLADVVRVTLSKLRKTKGLSLFPWNNWWKSRSYAQKSVKGPRHRMTNLRLIKWRSNSPFGALTIASHYAGG